MNGIGADYNAQIKQGAFSLRNIRPRLIAYKFKTSPADST